MTSLTASDRAYTAGGSDALVVPTTGVVTCRTDGEVLGLDDGARGILGCVRPETLLDLIDAHDQTRLLDGLRSTAAVRLEALDLAPTHGGERAALPVSFTVSPDPCAEPDRRIVVIGTEPDAVSPDSRANGRSSARRDPLTGLPDRSAIIDIIRRRMTSPRSDVAVLFFDLNGFKRINDAFGHAAGDEVLVAVAARLRRSTHPEDVAGRLGGDEFVVVTTADEPSRNPVALARELAAAIRRPVRFGQVDLHPRASVGVAFNRPGIRTAHELLKTADLAMYDAKQSPSSSSGSIAVASPRSRQRFERRRRIAAGFEEAWRREQIEFVYAPVRRLDDLEVLGAESFMRWQHADVGTIVHDELIEMATSPEHIASFTEWGLRTMTAEWADMRARYSKFADKAVSFNIDVTQLLLPGYLDMHLAAVHDNGLRRDDVIVEIQDGRGTRRDEVIEKLQEIAGAGLPITLDLTGVGHNALEFVQHVPVAGLRIGRELIEPMAGPNGRLAATSAAVLSGLRDMAAALGVQTLAGALTTAEQVAAARDAGLECGAGAALGEMAPIDEFEHREQSIDTGQPVIPALAAG